MDVRLGGEGGEAEADEESKIHITLGMTKGDNFRLFSRISLI